MQTIKIKDEPTHLLYVKGVLVRVIYIYNIKLNICSRYSIINIFVCSGSKSCTFPRSVQQLLAMSHFIQSRNSVEKRTDSNCNAVPR